MRRVLIGIFFITVVSPPFSFAEVAKTNSEKVEAATETKPKAEATKNNSFAELDKEFQKELAGGPDAQTNNKEQPSILWQFVRTLFTLAILLGIFYALFRLYRFKRNLPAQQFSAVTNLYEYPLGANQRLQIIEIAGRLMILGVSEQSVQLVSEITDKYTIDRIKLDCAEDVKAPRADFLTELSRAIKVNLKERWGQKNTGASSMPPNINDATLDAQRKNSLDRLNKLKSEKNNWRDKP
ncbi:MAG TPA: flagellar biosynthetic protein FliO [Turneriella sp.]|nr:flagellar biosynthetic protein FliO [Turneriella sp.]